MGIKLKKILGIVGVIIYSPLIGFLLYYLHNWLLPFALGDYDVNNFGGSTLALFIIAFITLTLSGVASGVALPVAFAKQHCGYSVNVINAIIMLISFGFSVCIPWQLYEDYNFWGNSVAIELTIGIITIYATNIFMTFFEFD